MGFLELLESETDMLLKESEDSILDDLAQTFDVEDESDVKALSEAMELDQDSEEFLNLLEAVHKRISADGTMTRMKSTQMRTRNATRTTGLSKTELRRRARKAAKTRKKSPALLRKAMKKRKKAMKKRKQRGL